MTVTDRDRWEGRFLAFLGRDGEFGDAAHDLGHVRRVVRSATEIAVTESADQDVVFAAAWLHDCVAVPKNSPDRAKGSVLAARAACAFLESAGWPAGQIPSIFHAIEAHSFTAAIEPRSLEAMVVQDADRLDALGAHGLARCLMLAGSWKSSLVHPTDPWAVSRELDDTKYAIDHFFAKLLRLPGTMRTQGGMGEAQRRAEVLKNFVREVARERGEVSPI
ncbi:MAG: hypothetical protein RL173_3454 [Fibrobacterota bacterium]|jgi:uncharacterized protein